MFAKHFSPNNGNHLKIHVFSDGEKLIGDRKRRRSAETDLLTYSYLRRAKHGANSAK
jgi:hypothetical protein